MNTTSIESATETASARSVIYNLQGMILRLGATGQDIYTMPAGTYIREGKTVFKR